MREDHLHLVAEPKRNAVDHVSQMRAPRSEQCLLPLPQLLPRNDHYSVTRLNSELRMAEAALQLSAWPIDHQRLPIVAGADTLRQWDCVRQLFNKHMRAASLRCGQP